MCTIIVALGVWPGRPLVVAANRDESLTRPARGVQLWPAGQVARRRVIAPRDDLAGGTWLGLNDAELFVGITNRRAGRIETDRRSRGELVFEALGAGEHGEAARALERGVDAKNYNPFHLLMADRTGASVLWGDGEALHRLELRRGIHWITERSFGAGESARHGGLAALAGELEARAEPPGPEEWRAILADHGPELEAGARPDPTAVRFDWMCVHAEPMNYGTRSATLVSLGRERGAIALRSLRGRPCEVAWTEHGELVEALGHPPARSRQ